jgi:hypothetical protein
MSARARLVLALAMVFAGYLVSAEATRLLIETLHHVPCETRFLTTVCAYPADSAASTRGLLWTAAFLCLAGLASPFMRRSSAYPFLALTIILCSSAVLWDCIFLRPIIHGPKIINDTLNILGAVIAASFVLVLALVRDRLYSLRRLAIAVAASFGVKTLSSLAYVALSSTLFGVTELFLLYVIYSFGSFTVHLMTLCGFVTPLDPRPIAAAAR